MVTNTIATPVSAEHLFQSHRHLWSNAEGCPRGAWPCRHRHRAAVLSGRIWAPALNHLQEKQHKTRQSSAVCGLLVCEDGELGRLGRAGGREVEATTEAGHPGRGTWASPRALLESGLQAGNREEGLLLCYEPFPKFLLCFILCV